VHVPDALDLAAFPPGRMVELAVSRRIDGVFELVRGGIARNRRS